MKNYSICQSCGMTLEKDGDRGLNDNGSISEKYCTYCYQNGKFTNDFTLDQMIEHNLKFIDEWNKGSGNNYTVDEARKQLQSFLPTLERWK